MANFEELESLDITTNKPAGPRIEIPTPHKVAVLILMKQYLSAKKLATESGLIYPPQARRNFCMLLLKLINGKPDMSYNELHEMLTPKCIDVLHLEAFEKAMSDMFAVGIEALFDFGEFQNIENMLCEQWGVSQYSMMGVYIRRVGVVLQRLTFPEMMALYKNICVYYEKGVRALSIGPRKVVAGGLLHRPDSPTQAESTVDKKFEDRTTSEKDTVDDNVLDSDVMYKDRNPHCKWSPKQAELFVSQQSELLEGNEQHALSPTELQKKLNEIIQDNPLSSPPYFLAYMNQLRVYDYFNAVDALHRAFDRSPVRMMSQEKGFQYFCVNLAVLHATFGHHREALTALKESIMLSQENSDKRCLTLANAWYCLLNNQNPTQRDKFLRDSQDTGLIQSLSLSLQFIVKLGTQTGFQPLQLFDTLHHSDELNNKNSLVDHISDSLALRSAIWCVYGRHEMSSLYGQMLLNMKKSWINGDINNTEGVANVLSSLALWLHVQGEMQLAQVVLQHARDSFPRHPYSQSWMISHCQIIIQNGIHRCRWYDALKACDQLCSMDPLSGMMQRAAVYLAKRYFCTALDLLDKLLQEKELSVLNKVRTLVLMAYCHLGDKRFSSESVELFLSASVQAAEAHMDYEQAIAEMGLAQVLLLLGLSGKAYRVIKNCIDIIQINGGLYDRAKSDFVFVRCLVSTADNQVDQKTHLLKTVPVLERSAEAFMKLGAHAKVLDVYVYLSKSFNTIGERELRNKYASEFRRYYNEHPIAREYLGMMC